MNSLGSVPAPERSIEQIKDELARKKEERVKTEALHYKVKNNYPINGGAVVDFVKKDAGDGEQTELYNSRKQQETRLKLKMNDLDAEIKRLEDQL